MCREDLVLEAQNEHSHDWAGGGQDLRFSDLLSVEVSCSKSYRLSSLLDSVHTRHSLRILLQSH